MIKVSEFDFAVPPELIAQVPAPVRDQSRLLVLNRETRQIEHRRFYDIVDHLSPGDLLVLNDTKVIPANLIGKKMEGGAKVEILLVSRKQKSEREKQASESRNQIWECLVKPGKRLKVGSRVIFGDGEVVGTVLEKTDSGEQIIEFTGELEGFMRHNGQIPLPPYIKMTNDQCQMSNEGKNPEFNIRDRYQTVYAEKEGASAAPTAGLHFTPELLEKIRAKGVGVAYVTLHTGLATFKPVYAENVEEHKMYSEYFEVPPETIAAVQKAKRVIAVGTTSVRALESIGNSPPIPLSYKERGRRGGELKGETNLFIYPGYKFKIVNAMITNFHWPRTTLIMLVSAFAGKDFIMRAYQEAIREKYRLFSFGDAMIIL
jgi:S-adenosylmethionine:tRNA ribosyltransferase-isomerase